MAGGRAALLGDGGGVNPSGWVGLWYNTVKDSSLRDTGEKSASIASGPSPAKAMDITGRSKQLPGSQDVWGRLAGLKLPVSG